jgi:pimeloyl-ACP methyl ester carboxylesterase
VTEHFGISELQLVLGWSMGAEQTYEWAVRYPDMVKRAAPFAGTAKTTPHCFMFVRLHEDVIKSDPAWNNGFYKDRLDVQLGLRRHAQVWSVMGALQARGLAGRGLHLAGRLQPPLLGRVVPADGPQQPALHGLEVAPRRRQPPHQR